MEGTTHTMTVTISVKVLKLDKDIPVNETDSFISWLKYKGKELGTGKHMEYYSYTDNYKDDIGVFMQVD